MPTVDEIFIAALPVERNRLLALMDREGAEAYADAVKLGVARLSVGNQKVVLLADSDPGGMAGTPADRVYKARTDSNISMEELRTRADDDGSVGGMSAKKVLENGSVETMEREYLVTALTGKALDEWAVSVLGGADRMAAYASMIGVLARTLSLSGADVEADLRMKAYHFVDGMAGR